MTLQTTTPIVFEGDKGITDNNKSFVIAFHNTFIVALSKVESK